MVQVKKASVRNAITESAYELCVHHHSPEVMRSALGAAEVQPVHA